MLYPVVPDRGRRAALVTILGGLITLFSSFTALSANLTLAWDPSSDPTVVGYNVYYGVASGVYTNMIPVGNATSVTVSNLVPGVTYYFAATTYNASGLESDFSAEISYTVPVSLPNQPPTLNPISNLTINENAGLQTVAFNGVSSGATNESQTLIVTATSSNTGLIPNPAVTYTSPSTNGTLSFTPAVNGSGSATITVTVNDGSASNNIATRTFTVTVNPVNQAPTLNPINNVTINENAAQQTVNFNGVSSGAANESQTLIVTATSSNTGLIPNPAVTYTSPSTNGTLSFTPAVNGSGSATITVTVNDGSASNNIATRTFTVTVNPVNQAPTLNPINNVTINENAAQQTVNFNGVSSGAANESQTLIVTATSSNTGLIPNPAVTYTSPSTNGTLSFTPAVNGSGSATITVTVNDGSASNNIATRTFTVTVNPVNQAPTLNPINNVTINENAAQQTVNFNGVSSGAANESQTLIVTATSSNTGLIPNPAVTYTSPSTNGTLSFTPAVNGSGSATITVTVNDGSASNNIATRTFTVTVNPVNQAPTLNPINNVTINENAAQQTVNFNGVSSGAANESQTLIVTATSSNTGLIPNPAVTYTSPSTNGTLSFTPAVNGSGSATITVTVNDGSASNNIATRTFTVTVNPVNQAPTLNPINNVTINENAAQQTVNFNGVSSGAANESQTLIVTATSSNTGLIPNPAVTYTSPSTNGTLSFTPAVNGSGSATITVTVNDGGASNNTVSRTFTVTVNGVNTPPTLNPMNNVTINENAAQQTVNFNGVSSGATNESQTLTVTATSSNTGLIPNPAVTYSSPNTNGTLSFTPATNGNGSATITVTVNDGGASNNTVSRTFTVTVNPVNQPPTMDPLANMTVLQDSGAHNVNLTGISSGVSNEVQTLTVTAVSSNPGLIPAPSVTYNSPNATGTLTFTPVPGGFGSAFITATVNDGGASNNTVSRQFFVVVDQPPSISAFTNLTIASDTATPALAFTVSDAETAASLLSVSATSDNTVLAPTNNIVFGGSSTNRTVTVTPAAGQTGIVNITITVSDGFALASSGFQLSVENKPAPPSNFHMVVQGSGNVTPNLSSESLTVGSTYTVTAVPAAGQEFAGWTGSVTSADPTVTFVLTSNFVLQANFTPQTSKSSAVVATTATSYSGLFTEQVTNINGSITNVQDLVRQDTSGSFSVATTANGKYSGRLQIGNRRYPFSGSFDGNGHAQNSIRRGSSTPLTLTLNLAVAGQGDQAAMGTVSDGTWTSYLFGDKAVFNARLNPAPLAGTYTLVLPGFIDDPTLPAGYGYAAARVSKSGTVSVAGMLADGTHFSQSVPVSSQGYWPFYSGLYGGRGSLLSWLAFGNDTNNLTDLNGILSWIKNPGASSKYYPGGFTTNCLAIGSAYVHSSPSAPALNLDSANVAFSGGDLTPSFTNSTSFVASRVENHSANHLGMSVAPGNGIFRGTVTDPVTGKPHPFSGAAFQRRNKGYGVLLGTSESSQVIIAE